MNSTLKPDVIAAFMSHLDFRFLFAYDSCSEKRMVDATHATAPRPEVLSGCTIKVQSPFGAVYVTLNQNGDFHPFELFLNVGKSGSDVAADAEAIARLCSLLLRISSPVSEETRIEWIIRSLTGIGGNGEVRLPGHRIRSLPDAVARALTRYLETPIVAVRQPDSPPGKHAA